MSDTDQTLGHLMPTLLLLLVVFRESLETGLSIGHDGGAVRMTKVVDVPEIPFRPGQCADLGLRWVSKMWAALPR